MAEIDAKHSAIATMLEELLAEISSPATMQVVRETLQTLGQILTLALTLIRFLK
jgi:hypothetical protein